MPLEYVRKRRDCKRVIPMPSPRDSVAHPMRPREVESSDRFRIGQGRGRYRIPGGGSSFPASSSAGSAPSPLGFGPCVYKWDRQGCAAHQRISAVPPVSPPPSTSAGPTVVFTATPSTVNFGQPVVVQWTTVGAVRCVGKRDLNPVVPLQEKVSTYPRMDRDYELECFDAQGNATSQRVQITVVQPS